MLDLEKIRKRAERARSAPWVSNVEGRDRTSGSNFIMIGSGRDRLDAIALSSATSDDQDFIAGARQDVPIFVDEILRLRQILKTNGISF